MRPLLLLRSGVFAAWPQGGNEIDSKPGTPRAEVSRQASPWMSLVEAVEHIRIVEDCDSIKALFQLKTEIGDGIVRVQWGDSQGPKDRPDPKYLQASQLLLVGLGVAPDNARAKIYRPLSVERLGVWKLWPPSEDRFQSVSNSNTGQNTSSKANLHSQFNNPTRVRHRRPASSRNDIPKLTAPSEPPVQRPALKTDIPNSTTPRELPIQRPASRTDLIDAARALYRQPGKPANINQAEKLLRRRFPGTSRPIIRLILKEKEFQSRRLKPGNQPKN